jgi:hypothetical protein
MARLPGDGDEAHLTLLKIRRVQSIGPPQAGFFIAFDLPKDNAS